MSLLCRAAPCLRVWAHSFSWQLYHHQTAPIASCPTVNSLPKLFNWHRNFAWTSEQSLRPQNKTNSYHISLPFLLCFNIVLHETLPLLYTFQNFSPAINVVSLKTKKNQTLAATRQSGEKQNNSSVPPKFPQEDTKSQLWLCVLKVILSTSSQLYVQGISFFKQEKNLLKNREFSPNK